MTLPLNMSLVTVQGRFILLDGTPMSGQVSFSPSVAVILNRDADVIISGAVFTAFLDATGFFQLSIPASDDPDLDPTDFTYAVAEPTGRTYSISVPQNVPGGVIDLIDVSPVAPRSGQTSILLRGVGIESISISEIGDVTVFYDNATSSLVGNARGPQGFTGPLGPVGPIGLTGPQGVQGVVGPEGPVGPLGPQGVAGPTGPVGPVGLTWRGPWSETVDYVADDAVAYLGASYFAVGDPPVGSDPTVDTVIWQPLSLRGAVGPQGPQGPAGPTGAQGPQGLQGIEGPTGATGPQGDQGVPGPSGPIRSSADYDNTVAPVTADAIRWNGTAYAPAPVIDGVVDHGLMTGLGDDDHPQYLNTVRGDGRYYTKTQTDSSLTSKADVTDPRFSDARTPTAHKTSHAVGGSDVLSPADIGAVPSTDLRLTDARTPVAHALSHDVGGSDDLAAYFVPQDAVGAVGGVASHADPRLTDARTPVAHKTSHAIGGLDAVNPADIGALAVAARGSASGVAALDTATKVPISQLPTGSTSSTVALGTDARLSDARTPVVHASTHGSGGSDPVTPAAIGASATGHAHTPADAGAVPTSRLVTASTGLTGGGALTADVSLAVVYGTAAGTSAQGNDSRLSNARTPTAHAASHASNGSDPVTPAAIGAAVSAHTHAEPIVAFPPVTLVEAATIATNASSGTHFRVTLTADRTLGVPTNPTDGQRVMWEVTASGATRTLTLASGSAGSFEFSDAVSTATVVTPSGKTTLFGAIYSLSRARWTVLGDAVTV